MRCFGVGSELANLANKLLFFRNQLKSSAAKKAAASGEDMGAKE